MSDQETLEQAYREWIDTESLETPITLLLGGIHSVMERIPYARQLEILDERASKRLGIVCAGVDNGVKTSRILID